MKLIASIRKSQKQICIYLYKEDHDFMRQYCKKHQINFRDFIAKMINAAFLNKGVPSLLNPPASSFFIREVKKAAPRLVTKLGRQKKISVGAWYARSEIDYLNALCAEYGETPYSLFMVSLNNLRETILNDEEKTAHKIDAPSL